MATAKVCHRETRMHMSNIYIIYTFIGTCMHMDREYLCSLDVDKWITCNNAALLPSDAIG
jgi:hypothetical protein